MPTRFRTGVTYIEIMIAVFLVLFIGAILFPVFRQPRTYVPTQCHQNIKHLDLALSQYIQDNNEVYPSGVNTAGNGWAGELYPYTKSTRVYQCPSDPSPPPFISYAENRNLAKRPLDELMSPSFTIALYETSTLNCDPSQGETLSTTGTGAPQNSTRHSNSTIPFGLYFAYIDGHVKYMAPSKVSNNLPAVSTSETPLGDYEATFAIK